MKTYILPGYSEKNKSWIDETVEKMSPEISAFGTYWKHWDSDQTIDGWIEEEARRIIVDSNHEKFNIIAKSVGTIVCMAVLKLHPELVNKIILCGIALNDFSPEDKSEFLILKNLPAEYILCIQNVDDNHGSYHEVEQFIHQLNPNIKIISQPREDHYYPYSDEFVEFLK